MKLQSFGSMEELVDHLNKEMGKSPWYDKLWTEMRRPYWRLQDFYYNFKNGIRQIIVWAPVIYRQRDYESIDLYDLILNKVKRLKKEYIEHCEMLAEVFKKEDESGEDEHKEENEHILRENDIEIKKMNECMDLIRKIQEDNYFSIEMKKGDRSDETKTKNYRYALELLAKDKYDMYAILSQRIERWWT